MALAIGIDLGGTAVKGGIVSDKGEIIHRTSIATHAEEGVAAVIDRIAGLAKTLATHASHRHQPPHGVGVGAPGTIRRSDGVILSAPNLNGWRDVPLTRQLRSAIDLPVVLNNDANSAALGEFVCGAGRDVQDMVMLTLGTGVGGGIISGGRLFVGALGNAGELGHTIVEAGGRRCNCGQLGCLETYASASATALRATEAIQAGEPSSMKSILDRGEPLSSRHVADAMSSGDALAKRIWEETCRYLAIACINLQHTFDPGCIVLAGGMSEAGDRLLQPLIRSIRELNSPALGPMPEIRLAELGNDAGFVGAALSVFAD